MKKQFLQPLSLYTVYFILYTFIFLYFILHPSFAYAATLYFSPSSGSYAVGSLIVLNVYVSSADQAMNAASGAISFPSDKLEVASLSKSGSIFSLWVQEPTFSNSLGTVNFEGIVLNPGFSGAAGKVISVNFRVKAAGNAALVFSSGSVLANDGKGTNILTGLGNAAFILYTATTGLQAPESTTPSVIAGTPPAPVISSLTHPDPDKWYNANVAKFRWQALDDVIAVRLLYDKNSTSQPQIVYSPPISEKEIQDLKDGAYYFHAQFKNKNGWGAIAHFRFRIDTQPPEPFTIKFVDAEETDNPRPAVLFDTTDSLSGIDYYKVKIGDGDFFNIAPEIVKSNSYTLPLQAPGKRTILVQAFDKAGNYRVAVEEFIIKSLNAPIITNYPKEINEGEIIRIEGKTYPDVKVVIFFKSEDDKIFTKEIQSDKNGDFTLIWSDQLKAGVYSFWLEATDSRGAKSEKSPQLAFAVKQKPFIKIGSLVITYLSGIISLAVIIFALLFLGYYLWYRFWLFRRRVKKEVQEAEKTLHKAFDFLKEEIQVQIRTIEKAQTKRQLTEEETKLINRFKKDLDDAEKYIRKEIEDVEKEIK